MSPEELNRYYQLVLLDLQQAAKTDRFSSKEAFIKYIEDTKKKGITLSTIIEGKKKELLDLYDEYHRTEEAGLDMKKYEGVNLNDQNYIVSTDTDTILKTDKSREELPAEFKARQNEISSARGQDSLANADQVYEDLRQKTKEEMTLIPLFEIVQRSNIDQEILNKVKFFITNKYINPYEYKVSPETGVFYNTETNEMLEVVKNQNNGKYEIKKGGTIVYSEDGPTMETASDSVSADPNQVVEEDTNEEEMIYQKGNLKVKRLLPPDNNRAAFAKATYLIITSVLIALAIGILLIIIKNK